MLGTLGFENYRIHCIIGAASHERVQPQVLFVDLKVSLDLSKPVASDKLEETADYTLFAKICRELAQKNEYYLLEKFAADALEEIFKNFPAIEGWIKVKKPNCIENADFAVVEFTKRRG